MVGTIIRGDALDLVSASAEPLDLIATDPPYAFGGAGGEHELSATVAVVLREAAKRLRRGHWMIIFSASSWRSSQYMIDAVRGIVDPVRYGTWVKPTSRTKVRTAGWEWASVNVIAFRKGPKNGMISAADKDLDWIECEPVINGRRAELPSAVAEWAVKPFAVPGGVSLDPFAGSGALVEAASLFGMDATGFEREAR